MAFKEEVDISEKSRRTDTEPRKEEGKSEKTFIIHVPIAINVIVSGSRFKAKHSLDSDEEDEPNQVEKAGLGDEDLAAQEEDTVVRGRV